MFPVLYGLMWHRTQLRFSGLPYMKLTGTLYVEANLHDVVIKWKHFLPYWPFVRGIQRSRVNSPHKGQWRGALMFSLICARINGWVNNGEAGDLRRNHAHYDVTVISECPCVHTNNLAGRNEIMIYNEKKSVWWILCNWCAPISIVPSVH